MMDRNLKRLPTARGRYDLRDEEGLYRLRRAYYGLVSYMMDDKVGGLLDALDETGLAESTVVVFASDHGDMLCERGMVQKRCFYEWSLPGAPDRPPSGRLARGYDPSPTPVSLIDLLPTFLRSSRGSRGSPAPRRPQPPVTPPAVQRRGPRRLRSGPRGRGALPCIMARQGRYKYPPHTRFRNLLSSTWTNDPGEWHESRRRRPRTARWKKSLRGHILDRFDPDAMARGETWPASTAGGSSGIP